MALTGTSAGAAPQIENEIKKNITVALAGNPNVGKSTVFNNLTGMAQHTGNWPGKTVSNARGRYSHKGKSFELVDIPGAYSLMANSAEEEIARDYICFGGPDAVVVVADATCLERNLNLVLQTMEINDKVVLCVNLMDEAKKKRIKIDLEALSSELGIPVVGTSARAGSGLDGLADAVASLTDGSVKTRPLRVSYGGEIEKAVAMVEPAAKNALRGRIDSRWVSLKLLDPDESLLSSLRGFLGSDIIRDGALRNAVTRAHDYLERAGITPERLRDAVVTKIVKTCESVSGRAVIIEKKEYLGRDRKIDAILTSRLTGIPIMLALLSGVLWLTISGANYPSKLISNALFSLEKPLFGFLDAIGAPAFVSGALISGVYRTLAWVVSVMLPPMAIFFPLFTLLEDSGYLPRVAFNLDNFFRKACAHGKQSLTMCMGFGCNAAGITGCRIIDSPRERIIAIVTNSFVPCNGKFPTLVAVITMFFAGTLAGALKSAVPALMLTGLIVLGVVMTVFTSKLLSKTVLKGLPSAFNLELPPYRRPQFGRVIVRSIIDRTLFVLGRAAAIAAPSGLVIWLMANINAGGASLLSQCAGFLDPFARLLGLDGYIFFAFILGFPANEIVVPIIIMSYMASGSLTDFENLWQLRALLVSHGWTWLTAVCVMLFSLFHWPCGTACMTVKKETRSLKWTLLAFAVPTVTGVMLCLVTASAARLLGIA